jgi:hypothetical protein
VARPKISSKWERLWVDPTYLRLQAAKDKAGHAWNQADAHKNLPSGNPEEAARLDLAYKRALKRLYTYEDKFK